MADAKITVEASLIIPLIISIICALLYEALLSCDRGAINMSVDRIIEETAASEGRNEKEMENMMDLPCLIREELTKKLMLYSVEEVSYEKKKNRVILSVHAVPKATFGIAGMFSTAFGKYSINRSVKISSVCRDIRRINIVKDNS